MISSSLQLRVDNIEVMRFPNRCMNCIETYIVYFNFTFIVYNIYIIYDFLF